MCERLEKKRTSHRIGSLRYHIGAGAKTSELGDYFSLLPTSVVKRRQIVLEMNSWESHPSSEKERKFRRILFTSQYQKKCRTDMQSCRFANL